MLIDFLKIQALFNLDSQLHSDLDDLDSKSISSIPPESYFVNVNVYSLAFLKTAGNLQANGIPHCFYPVLAQVNQAVCKNLNSIDPPLELELDDELMDVNPCWSLPLAQAQVVKLVSCQFYNYITHSMATRSGRHDSQQGSVTAAISSEFSQTFKDKKNIAEKQAY